MLENLASNLADLDDLVNLTELSMLISGLRFNQAIALGGKQKLLPVLIMIHFDLNNDDDFMNDFISPTTNGAVGVVGPLGLINFRIGANLASRS
jgi:hypothetical protein